MQFTMEAEKIMEELFKVTMDREDNLDLLESAPNDDAASVIAESGTTLFFFKVGPVYKFNPVSHF